MNTENITKRCAICGNEIDSAIEARDASPVTRGECCPRCESVLVKPWRDAYGRHDYKSLFAIVEDTHKLDYDVSRDLMDAACDLLSELSSDPTDPLGAIHKAYDLLTNVADELENLICDIEPNEGADKEYAAALNAIAGEFASIHEAICDGLCEVRAAYDEMVCGQS